MDLPRLFHFRVSHYNEKVRWALDWKGWPHRRTALLPGFHVPRARLLSGQQRLPILRLDGRVIAGSNHIIAELERLRPEPALYPRDPALRSRALELEAYFDREVAPDLRRLFWATYLDDTRACARMATAGAPLPLRLLWQLIFPAMRPLFRRNMGVDPARLAGARDALPRHFDRLERELGPSGFLVGDSFSVADLTAAAVLTAILRPPEFPYPLPTPWPAALTALRDGLRERPGYAWAMALYRTHRGTSAEVSR